MIVNLETTMRWFEKMRDNAAKQGRNESALLWADGLAHLIEANTKADRYREALERVRLLLDYAGKQPIREAKALIDSVLKPKE